ncbi:MAG: TIGR00725 family protein [Candidatus Poseidoniales archaeon]|nr:MAG: TIGR00725 family protein [Candidatus Poseidoniales archaeon]
MRKPIVSVFGSHDLDEAPDVEVLCEDLGRTIVDLGCRVACGGLGGSMAAVCKGARSSKCYQSGDTIGILPMEDANAANPHVDVVIPTGLGLFRNMLVARAGDVCIAVRGGAGTLSEIAFAWQLNKPVATMSGTGGWATELAGSKLDYRREGYEVTNLEDVKAANTWISEVLGL